jgi:nucleoside transporter
LNFNMNMSGEGERSLSAIEMKQPRSGQTFDNVDAVDDPSMEKDPEIQVISSEQAEPCLWQKNKHLLVPVVYVLLYTYWFGATIWDYQSHRNHQRDSIRGHYTAWVLHVFFGCMTLYLLCSYCNTKYCANVDDTGRDEHGRLRRPDKAVHNYIVTASPKTQMILSLCFTGAWLIWVVIECGDDGEKWQCFLGLWVFVGLSVCISYHPRQIKWRPVIWGLFLQWYFGYIVLNTSWGYDAFDWLSEQITRFLQYSDVGAEFVFGDTIHGFYTFAFRVLPTVTWFSATVYVLYYLGVIQFVISGIANVMQVTLGTSASESLSAAGNVFVGQTEAPLLVRPYLDRMTASEVNAVMTGGFSTIAGGVLGLYISYGIDAHHLLAASFMSAPAALAVAKIILPELEDSETAVGKKIQLTTEILDTKGMLDAITKGTLISITLVANICALLITFLGLIDFADNAVAYLGERIGFVEASELSFTKICGYIFYPLSWLMGAPHEDCLAMGELIGYKIFTNELIAYTKMGCFFQDNEIGSRTAFMATYALCGFANFGSMGIQIGGLSPLAPNNKDTLLRVAFRAMIGGNIACFMTACIAGILINVDSVQPAMECNQ